MQYVYPLTYGKPSKLDHFPNTNAVCLPKPFPTKIAPHLSGRWRSSMSPVLLGEFAGQWWAVVGSGGQWWTFCTRRDLTLMVNKLFFFLVFPNIALLYSSVVNCYESLLLITHIYIYIIHMIVYLKVHVEIFHYKGRQGSNMRPRESFFRVRESIFLRAKDLAKKTLIRDPRER